MHGAFLVILVLSTVACSRPPVAEVATAGRRDTHRDEGRRDGTPTPAVPTRGEAQSIAARCAQPDPHAAEDPCDGLDWDACDGEEACEPRQLDADEPGYPGVLCSSMGIPGEPGYNTAPSTVGLWVDCDPSQDRESACGGLVCVPVLNECRDSCSNHSDCPHGFYCGDNGLGPVHCVDCRATRGYRNLVDPDDPPMD